MLFIFDLFNIGVSSVIKSLKMPRQLNDEEIAQCQAAFCTVDKDDKGTIDAKDLGMVIESLGNAWFTGMAANTIVFKFSF